MPNTVTMKFGFYMIRHEHSRTSVTNRLRIVTDFMRKNVKVPQDVKIIIMGNAFVFNPYLQYRYNSDNEYHAKCIPSYLLGNYHSIVFIGNNLFQ